MSDSTVELEPELAALASRRAAAAGLSLAQWVQALVAGELGFASAEDDADDLVIAQETLRRGDGMTLEDFRIRMGAFGRRKAV
jgi:hypothetical protein